MWELNTKKDIIKCNRDNHVFSGELHEGEKCKCGQTVLIKKDGNFRPVSSSLYNHIVVEGRLND